MLSLPAVADEDTEELAAEARLFGRYLAGRVPPPELVARYVAAAGALFDSAVPPAEAAVLRFVHRHAWSLGPLDAASGLLQPGGALRSRLLVMAAVLEASPEFADAFLPRNVSLARFLGRLAVSGTIAVGQALLGAVLLPVASRART